MAMAQAITAEPVCASRAARFKRLIEPLLGPLYHTACGLVGDSASAEDLVQDTAVKAFKYLDRFQEGTNVKAWVFRILRNTFLNQYRLKKRRPQMLDLTDLDAPVPHREPAYFTIDDFARFREQIGDLAAAALEKLSPEFRLLFLLSTMEELSYKEIAAIVDVPVGTVMSRLFRARQFLREELAAYAREQGFLRGERHHNREEEKQTSPLLHTRRNKRVAHMG